MNLFEILIYPGITFTILISFIYFGILRKLAARMQSRIGPPIWQPIYDFFKLLGKENIDPEQAKFGFLFWPLIAFSSIIVAGLLTPIAGIAPLPGDLIVLVYFLAFASLSIYLSGFSSSNPYGVTGAIRGITQMLAYEFPFILSIIIIIVSLDTLSPMQINAYQMNNSWLALRFPLAAIAFFVSVLAKIEFPPFHIPNAHQEIVGGYSVEYTGTRLALIELTHTIKAFVLISLGIALFFGGSACLSLFLIKSLSLLFIITLIRVLMARLRIDHALKFYWLLGFITLIDLARVLM